MAIEQGSSVLDLETLKETIRLEIRKELKIKEGAENLQKVTNSKKTRAHISTILKNSSEKLETLHRELHDLLAQVPDDDGKNTPSQHIFCLFCCILFLPIISNYTALD